MGTVGADDNADVRWTTVLGVSLRGGDQRVDEVGANVSGDVRSHGGAGEREGSRVLIVLWVSVVSRSDA